MRLPLFSLSIVFLLSLFAATASAGHQACWTQTIPNVDAAWSSARDFAMIGTNDIFALRTGGGNLIRHFNGASWSTIEAASGMLSSDVIKNGLMPGIGAKSFFLAGHNGSSFSIVNVVLSPLPVVYPNTIYATTAGGSRIPYNQLSFKALVNSGGERYAILRNTAGNYDVVLVYNRATGEFTGRQFNFVISSWAPDTGGKMIIGSTNGFIHLVSPDGIISTIGTLGSVISALGTSDTGIRYASVGDPFPVIYRSATLGSWVRVTGVALFKPTAFHNDVMYTFDSSSQRAYATLTSGGTSVLRQMPYGGFKTAKLGSDIYVLTNGPAGRIYKLTCANTAAPSLSIAPVPLAIRNAETRITATASDADHVAAYSWNQTFGDPVGYAVISGATSAVYRLRFSRLGGYRFSVMVTDGGFPIRTSSATATVTVANFLPSANAGGDVSIPVNSIVELNGVGTDSDGFVAGYKWGLSAGDSDNVIQRTPEDFIGQGISANITAVGMYTFRLTVTDNDGGTNTDDVTITVTAPPEVPVEPVAPTADARVLVDGSPVSTVAINATINLSSDATSNPDSRPFTYTWNLTSGSASAFENLTPMDIPFVIGRFSSNGTFTFLLNVTDDRGLSSNDTVTLDVTSLAVSGCFDDFECGDGFMCSAGSCVPSENVTETCIADSDCSEGFACVAGLCAAITGAACIDNFGCDANEECLGNTCVALSCRRGEVARDNECVATCVDELNCRSGQICSAGVCQACAAGERVVENECVLASEVTRCGGVDHAAGTGQCCNSVWIPGITQCPLPETANRTTTQHPDAGGANDLPLLIVGGVIVLLAVIAAAYFLFFKKPPGESGGAENAGETAEGEEATEAESGEESGESTGGEGASSENKGRKWI